MAEEIVALFAPVPEGWVVDATLGGAGHSRALLEAHAQLSVLGIDQDPVALAAAGERLAPYGDRARTVRARFDALAEVVAEELPEGAVVSGVLFDLGVSSPQLDVAERGFSYRQAAPLDMRMDPDAPRSAADVVNGYPEAQLAKVLRDLGDERFAGRIAKAIVAARPVHTTTELADLVRDAIPAPARRTGGHPAKRTFQAIRIEVNEELDILPGAIDDATKGLVVLVETEDGSRLGLVVDEILGQQQVVIKSLESNFRRLDGVAAATILGDGRVALILDVAGLREMSRHTGDTGPRPPPAALPEPDHTRQRQTV